MQLGWACFSLVSACIWNALHQRKIIQCKHLFRKMVCSVTSLECLAENESLVHAPAGRGQEMESFAQYISSFYEAALVETCQLLAWSTGCKGPYPQSQTNTPGLEKGREESVQGSWWLNDALGDFHLSFEWAQEFWRSNGLGRHSCPGSLTPPTLMMSPLGTQPHIASPPHPSSDTSFLCFVFSKHNCRLNCVPSKGRFKF